MKKKISDFSLWVGEIVNKLIVLGKNKWVKTTIQLIILAFCVYFVAHIFYTYRYDLLNTQINLKILFIAFILCLICTSYGGVAWYLIISSIVSNKSIVQLLRSHYLSNLQKYIPGYIWQYLGKSYLTHDIGISMKVIGFGLIYEMYITILNSLGVGLISVPAEYLSQIVGNSLSKNVVLSLGLAIVLAGNILPVYIINHFYKSKYGFSIRRPIFLSLSGLLIVANYFLFGYSFNLIWISISMDSSINPLFFPFAIAMSYLIGLLVIIAPMGIGVREYIIWLILHNQISLPEIVLLVVLLRVMTSVCEFMFAGMFFGKHRTEPVLSVPDE